MTQNTGSRSVPPFMLGETSNIQDNSEQEFENIKHLIPQEGTANLEDGFQKMLNILGKQAPSVPSVPSVQALSHTQNTQEQPNSPFAKHQSRKEEQKMIEIKEDKQIEKPEEAKKDTKTKKKKEATKTKTRSEELGLNYPDEEILPLFDSIMTKGYASEAIMIRNHKIVFRTTIGWEDQEIVLRIDKQIGDGLNLKTSTSYFYDLYSLAATIEQFGANYFEPILQGTKEERTKSFDERVEFLESLGSPLISILVEKRLAFLKKVQFLLDNYDRLLKAF